MLRASRPHCAILGREPNTGEYCELEQHPEAQGVPGLLIYRFDSLLVFFNAEYFKQRVRSALAAAPVKPRAFVFDIEAVTMVDVTEAYALEEIRAELEARGIDFAVACSRTALREQLNRSAS